MVNRLFTRHPFLKILCHHCHSRMCYTFPLFSSEVQINVVHLHLQLLELKVEMFPPRREGRVYKCSSTLKSKNNTNPSDYVTGTIRGSTKVNDLESNNFSFAAGASLGCWDVWRTRFYTPITAERSV